jgi:hypothetical protein
VPSASTPPDLLDHPLIGERYFFPRVARPRSRLDVDAGDALLACALHRASPEGRTVVHFHGNGEVVARCPTIAGLVLEMHTRHDGLVDVSHAERLAAWAGGSATLQVFEIGDHNSILFENQEAYFGLLEAFLAGRAGS